ncbi:ATP-dependent DNA helicase RecG [Prolixibacter denitrificans]|uniref:ATP-dependent DNA helicase RecG n=1 Tax=Prolixibacter denitrificans TaxID=1541063 RepID=A0A2P8CCL5_9BACT|nr:ATP-dependent DNA helicase RecG [Prolixibacter denitrificans]PSK82672.1 ATP-dependent DNA helicase RecG [Prolixibacter denitrificans]GET21506.1 ATP-dependent DNA helicase RecG [Prolixibacter denitrificans]
MPEFLDQDIKFLPGVGPRRASLLNSELKIFTFRDLLYYFPFKYVDRTRFYNIREIDTKLPYIQVKGRITGTEVVGEGRSQRLVAYFTDGTGVLELVWFKGIKYVRSSLSTTKQYVVFGKPTEFNGQYNIVHPELEEAEDQQSKHAQGYIQAFYNTTDKLKKSFLNSKVILKLQQNLFPLAKGKLRETLPAWLVEKYNLMSLPEAIGNIHFPQNPNALRKAEYRLKFEELFYIQLKILHLKADRQQKFRGHPFTIIGDYFNEFFHNHLPFELTGAQKRVIKEIRKDVGSGKQMNRLLQGDVGSGKTMVGLMTMLMALDNGFQSSMMAPTEILANQHYASIKRFLGNMSVNVRLLTGSTKKSERKEIHEQLENGELHILIGTHALLEEKVKFKNLGMVIIDEQHRFGVAQRARLWRKNYVPPHVLVMTATPIPRTLAMTVYGDLDVSVIDELPPGRKPIKTMHFFENNRKKVYDFMRKEIEIGRQIYMVYPLISESEKMDFKNLEEGYKHIKTAFPEPKYHVSMVHGRMRPADKDAEMMRFKNGETNIMVATTVIEVGVDVPNASVMVIESTERFGLSQLHQLRGRVGRGAEQSFCILMSKYKLGAESRKRIETMVATNDGFEIAEADMKLRGPGDIEGTQQSGMAFDMKIANIAKDGQILQYARDIATDILDDDPTLAKPENNLMRKQLIALRKNHLNWSSIS